MARTAGNNAVQRSTACAVTGVENQSSVLGDGCRSGKLWLLDPQREAAPPVFDFMTLKLAIYFVAPVVVLYISAYLCAGLFTPIAQIFVDRDISHDTAMDTMGFVITATTGVAVLAYLTTHVLWVTIVAASTSFFFVGAIKYSRIHKDGSTRRSKEANAQIGLAKGFLISAVFSSVMLAIALAVIFSAGIAP